jgi:DNA-binding response OmpR family regulator
LLLTPSTAVWQVRDAVAVALRPPEGRSPRPTKGRILVVGEDLRLAKALGAALRRVGYEVDHASTGRAALDALPADLVLLDRDLADSDGIEVCRALRARDDRGIIVLSTRHGERDRVLGLRSGADDYMMKPIHFQELHARVEAVMRRVQPRFGRQRVVGRLRVDVEGHQAYIQDQPVKLTRKEFEILCVLVAQPEAVVHRAALISKVWRTTWHGTSSTLNVHMASLRVKLRGAVSIETIRGIGYRIVGC